MSHSHTCGCGATKHSLEREREANASVVCAASCEKHLSARQNKWEGELDRKEEEEEEESNKLRLYYNCIKEIIEILKSCMW